MMIVVAGRDSWNVEATRVGLDTYFTRRGQQLLQQWILRLDFICSVTISSEMDIFQYRQMESRDFQSGVYYYTRL